MFRNNTLQQRKPSNLIIRTTPSPEVANSNESTENLTKRLLNQLHSMSSRTNNNAQLMREMPHEFLPRSSPKTRRKTAQKLLNRLAKYEKQLENNSTIQNYNNRVPWVTHTRDRKYKQNKEDKELNRQYFQQLKKRRQNNQNTNNNQNNHKY